MNGKPIVAFKIWKLDKKGKLVSPFLGGRAWEPYVAFEAKCSSKKEKLFLLWMLWFGEFTIFLSLLSLFEVRQVLLPLPFITEGTEIPVWSSGIFLTLGGFIWASALYFLWELKSHDSPNSVHKCGINAFASEKELLEKRGNRLIGGEIYLWGKILEYEQGYRAQYGYPKTFTHASCSRCGELTKLTNLEELRGIPGLQHNPPLCRKSTYFSRYFESWENNPLKKQEPLLASEIKEVQKFYQPRELDA